MKLSFFAIFKYRLNQPPSGGCVLKHFGYRVGEAYRIPAAFGRLCVETTLWGYNAHFEDASRLRAAVC